MTNSVRCQCS